MDISQKIEELSHEMKILKNEIRQILLDIREHVLTYYQNAPAERVGEEGVEELAEQQADSGKNEEQPAPATGSGTTVNIGTDLRGAPDVRMEAPAGRPGRGQAEVPSSASFRDEPADGGIDFRDEPFGSDMGFGGGRDDFSSGDFGGERQRGGRQDFSAGDFGGERQQKGRGGQGDDMLGMMQLLNGMGGQGGGDEYANYGLRQPAPPPNGGMDLTTIAMLARWVSNGIRRVGRKRMQSIVEMYQMTGNLSPKAREVIVRLVRLSDSEDPSGSVPMTACIPLLMQLNTILGGRQQRSGGLDPALLSILLG